MCQVSTDIKIITTLGLIINLAFLPKGLHSSRCYTMYPNNDNETIQMLHEQSYYQQAQQEQLVPTHTQPNHAMQLQTNTINNQTNMVNYQSNPTPENELPAFNPEAVDLRRATYAWDEGLPQEKQSGFRNGDSFLTGFCKKKITVN